jgi:diguanylate cyclase (GGDEF)-like protein
MKRLSPLVQMTMALVGLAGTLVILGTLFFDVIPDRDAALRTTRQSVADALSVQVAERLARDDVATVEKTLRHVITRTPDLRSVGVRRADGTLVVDTGSHITHWKLGVDEQSRIDQITVPLSNERQRWGRVELAFADRSMHPVAAFFAEPLVQLLLFMSAAGWIVFGLYMRRALQHLDPSTVVPARVQGAFDAMAEGIVVLDAKGRLMMCNDAFRSLDESLQAVNMGSRLAALPWLQSALPGDPGEHPWARAMSDRAANTGTLVEVGEGAERRRFMFSAAPISDAGGAVRGCMVTINDLTALHRANEALQHAMTQLQRSKQEVEDKNAELERLATRDPLTGVMNRRAFQTAFDALAKDASARNQNLACLMIDIDLFKAVNDTHGHGVGDRVIQEVARRLQDSLRGTDLVSRWGGEEFCVVTAGLDAEGAAEFAERVRRRIEREAGAAVREVPGLRITCSVGVSLGRRDDSALAPLVDRADRALYQAKRAGRNRVELSTGSVREATVDDDAPKTLQCLDAQGWKIARKRLLSQAREADRALACIVASFDETLAARYGDDLANAVTTALAAWVMESSPRRGVVARTNPGEVTMLTVGWGLQDAEVFASDLLKRARSELAHQHGADASRRFGLCIGVDALPARANGAVMLPERAAQALQRRRRADGEGLSTFTVDPSRGVTAPRNEGRT